jgi:hypothetical protein
MMIATSTYSCGHWRKGSPALARVAQRCPHSDHDAGDWPRGELVDVTERPAGNTGLLSKRPTEG